MAAPEKELAANDIAIGAAIAHHRDLNMGDNLRFRASDDGPTACRIVEILSPKCELFCADLLFMNNSRWREFVGVKEGRYTDLVLSVRNPHETIQVREKVMLTLPHSTDCARRDFAYLRQHF